MAQRFALQTSGLLAGVVAMSGAGLPNDAEWTPGGTAIDQYSPTPIILIAGTIDGVVPFDERAGPLAGALPSFDGWGTINGCSAASRTEDDIGAYTQYNYGECSGSTQVTLLQVFDAGHHPFPKGEDPFKVSPVNTIASKCLRGEDYPIFKHFKFTCIFLTSCCLPLAVIPDCPFRGIPMFYEPDCQLKDLDTPRIAWEFIQQFQLAAAV